ncbi:hypothetical protein [uncultured Gammaproteobacteria bacterium]|nr:hypothetical protein [uncultured Gammaproteobacteria bacterium]
MKRYEKVKNQEQKSRTKIKNQEQKSKAYFFRWYKIIGFDD